MERTGSEGIESIVSFWKLESHRNPLSQWYFMSGGHDVTIEY